MSNFPATSVIIFSAAESKLTSLFGMVIFNNGLQCRVVEEDTLRAMISADRNVSRDYKQPGRETAQGMLLDKCLIIISRTNVNRY